MPLLKSNMGKTKVPYPGVKSVIKNGSTTGEVNKIKSLSEVVLTSLCYCNATLLLNLFFLFCRCVCCTFYGSIKPTLLPNVSFS